MPRERLPRNYADDAAHPIGATHPKYPEFFRVTGKQKSEVALDDNSFICDECPMCGAGNGCDRSCGAGRTWVNSVTWLRIRMMEMNDDQT